MLDNGIVKMTEIMLPTERRRTIFFILFAISVLLIFSNIPLAYGFLQKRSGFRFMGICAGVRDANVYFMMMIQGSGSSPVLENYFLPGEPNAIYHGFFWFVLGKLSHCLGVSNLIVYHASRTIASILFVPIFYIFAHRFLNSATERVTAVILTCFGAGSGWIVMLTYRQTRFFPFIPADVATPEANAFYTLMTFPHLSVALIFMLLCMQFIWNAMDTKRATAALIAGLCGLILGLIHAFSLLVLCLALAAYTIASFLFYKDTSPIRYVFVFGILSACPIVYYAYIAIAKPGLLPVAPVRSPSPLAYLVGFGPLILMTTIRLVSLWRARSLPKGDLFMFCCVVASSMLLYSYPILSQEARAVLGLQIPLVILSVRALFWNILPAFGLGLEKGSSALQRIGAATAISFFVAFTFPSTCYNIADRVNRLKHFPQAFSLTTDEYEALEYLRDLPGKGIVLSHEWMGNFIPRITHKRAFSGQVNYPSYDRRTKMIQTFFAESTTDLERDNMLQSNDIEFIFHGLDERTIGKFRPHEAPYLQLLFHRSSVDIYRYEPQDTSAKDTHSP